MPLIFRLLLILAAAMLASPLQAAQTQAGKLRLISAFDHVGGGELSLGLEFDLQPGWKIYWRSPGDAGFPPKLDWTGSDNLDQPVLFWPAPHRFELAGLQNHGYGGRVILPIAARALDASRAVRARLNVDFLACAQICVPMRADLALDLPAGAAGASMHAQDIARFRALVPGPAAANGLEILSFSHDGQGDQARLTLRVRGMDPFQSPDLFIEPGDLASFGAPQVSLSDGGRVARLSVGVAPGSLTRPLGADALTITLTDGSRAVEASLTPQAGQETQADGDGLVLMLALALLGGLILNLMPCVLPVLSIKLMGVLSQAGLSPVRVRGVFIASGLGIVASFWLLAGLAVGLKAAGQAVGWGIQFQQPAFLVVMIALLLIFAANLWGLFEIRLPLPQAGGGSGWVGHFLSGMLATLLATPCSAPFVGTALGFALARGPLEIGLIFTCMGLGMALPFFAMAVWPGLVSRLPRPGAWMLGLKRVLALALAATALWLGLVLADQEKQTQVGWVAFDQGAIASHVAAGKLVLVDVTADWCITCKVNKALVLERGPVAEKLKSGDIIAMRADWTRPNDAIAAYLAGFGRFGIPFNAVYGPKAPNGLALPELLTDQAVLEALSAAR